MNLFQPYVPTPLPVPINHRGNIERFLGGQISWFYAPPGYQHPNAATVAATWLKHPAFQEIAPDLHTFFQTTEGRITLNLAIAAVVPLSGPVLQQLLAEALLLAAAKHAEPKLAPVVGARAAKIGLGLGALALAGWLTRTKPAVA